MKFARYDITPPTAGGIKIITRGLIPLLLCLISTVSGYSQHLAIRNNLIYDATLSPNIGVEVGVDSLWSLGLNAGLNVWDLDKADNKKWRHLLVNPSLRRYFGQQRDAVSLHGPHYWEADLIYSHFNAGNISFPFSLYKAAQDHRFQGDLVALGGKYGYSWVLARRWRVEAEAGVAVGYAWFKEYDCAVCGTYYGRDDRIFLLPQLGINVVYIIN